jgi:LmbE family N-acetylglucosaminyl deacetylase
MNDAFRHPLPDDIMHTNRRRWILAVIVVGAVTLPAVVSTQRPAQDDGATGAWQKLLKVQTTASAMHTTAHPDDEHGGVLAMLSRGQGARLSLLTLNRGESGDNAVGSELFDAVGLIRTEELLIADRYYGVDRQYFTTMIDYGFSKRLDETLGKWGRENVLRDVVRIIRTDRPFVLIARFQGNERDGHGNHEAAGLMTQEAFKAAAEPTMFPEQVAAGLRPWQPLKLYMGGVRENEDWTLRVDTGVYDPVLGDSYQTFARLGLSFQRSQNSGQFSSQPGPVVSYYKRLQSVVDAPAKETTFFDGIDTTIPGVYRALRKDAPAGADAALQAIDREVKSAVQSFKMIDPSASAPALARALAATRAAQRQLGSDPEVASLLTVKEEQLQAAIRAALGVTFTAVAQPAGTQEPTGQFAAFARPAAMPPVVPGQSFAVRTTFANRSPIEVKAVRVTLEGKGGWAVQPGPSPRDAANNVPVSNTFTVTVPQSAALTRPYFSRASIQDPHYTVADQSQLHRPAGEPALIAVANFEVNGVPGEVREPVTRLESNLPYGYDTRVLAVVPAIAVTLSPARAVLPLGTADKNVHLRAEVLNNVDGKSEGSLNLHVPAGWKVEPASQPFQFDHAGERAYYAFTVTVPSLEDRDYRIEAVASSGGRDFREGYEVIQHRDLETRYLYREAAASVRGVDVRIASGLKVGYVMGIGDDVPAGLSQLGVDVQLLSAQDLASADLSRFNAIMTGTRAYAVREDLKTYNRRLLDYAKNGGNLIVLYNTQEFVPSQYAPFPAELPRTAEEVSEEDSPVEILAPSDPVFNTPNTITKRDFDNWVEQRGSKFWSTWDAAYTPMIATWDQGQSPQKGGWLHAKYGSGHYTYFAYAFHRQLPYGVPGAYRLLANLLSLNRPAAGSGGR